FTPAKRPRLGSLSPDKRPKVLAFTLKNDQNISNICLNFDQGLPMKRSIDYHLSNWKQNPRRKSLILRGARQVGKTHAVRNLGKQFDNFVEINFEVDLEARTIFDGNLHPDRIVQHLSLHTNQDIIPGKTLLFLDEAQAQPQALIALRYFYEEMPGLHVIAAGSLLNFAIAKVGVPVGRVEFLHMHPMSFIEFLYATGHQRIAKAILLEQSVTDPLTGPMHDMFLRLLNEYLVTGGMPEAVQIWKDTHDLTAVMAVQQSIARSYTEDIPKYAPKSQAEHVDVIFKHIPHMLGQRFKNTNIPGEYTTRELAPAIDLLEKAMIARRVYHTSAQGFPLAAQSDLRKYKLLLVDVAVTQKLLNSDPREWILNPKISYINKGPLLEAFVGQELIAYQDPTIPAELFYWYGEGRGSTAELDYIITVNRDVVPVEVKSNRGSSLKSMRSFLTSHPNSKYGVRFSTHNYSVFDTLHSYPLYAVAALFPQTHAALLAL
ncbi:MAG: AAA family ATPase, partial [Alphaproteobacteria bacterium]